MFSFLYRFAIGFGCLAVVYYLYATIAVPLIDREVSRKKVETRQPVDTGNQRYEKLITEAFPKDDWIRGRCKILDARQSILFFKEARQLEDGNWEVKPFTMFLNPDQALVEAEDGLQQGSREKPIILRTEEGAYIKFEDGSSPNSPSGKFSGARMPGQVTVMREESTAGSDDDFEFVTRNIQVNKKQILAVNPVRFRYGKHFGNGHNLTINLAVVGKNKKPDRRLPIVRNLKTVELAHLDKLMLIPSDAAPADRQEEKKVSLGGEAQLEKSPVQITCSGPFRLDFGKSEMVLFDKVHLEQLHETGPHDHLYCNRLQVRFRLTQKSAEGSSNKDKIQFQSVIAHGQPARLEVDSRNAQARANTIEYRINRRTIHCRTDVMLRDGAYRFSAPEIQYRLTTNQQLGTGWASGPGEIIGESDDRNGQFRANWESEFNLQPHDGKKVLSLHGQPRIVVGDRQTFQCEELHFWIWEKRKRGPRPKWNYFPAQMLGLRQVTLNAPAFGGKVDEVRVFWPPPVDPTRGGSYNRQTRKKGVSATQFTSSRKTESGADSKPERPGQPAENRVIGNGHLATAYLTRENELRSFRLEGRTRMTLADGRKIVEQVHVQSVDLRPQQVGHPARVMVEVRGSDIQLDATGKKDAFKMTLQGFPASVESDGMKIRSNELSLDQSTNKAWSHLPGTVEISPAIRAERKPLGPEAKTSIRWNKRFDFDGWVLRLTDDITFEGLDYLATGEQVEYEGQTRQLAARTNRFVSFQKEGTGVDSSSGGDGKTGDSIRIQEFALLEQAHVKAITREDLDQVQSVEEIYAEEINVRTDTGDARATGPGSIRSIRRGRQGDRQVDALSRQEESGKEPLSCIEVVFEGQILGNVNTRKGTVSEKIRAVYGPAADWNVRYDPDGKSIFGDEIYLNCDQLKFRQWKPVNSPKPVVEMAAVGNTEIEGKKFRALATQLTYTEENAIVRLEGLDRSHAKIWFRKNEKQPWQYGEAKQFSYQQSTSEIVGSEDLKEMRFLQFEAPQKRRR